MDSDKTHWENLYQDKKSEDLSWTEDTPSTSLSFIHRFQLPKTASIIDVGGGESKLAGCLVNEGYENITVLDIAENSIERAKIRIGNKSTKIKWIVQNVLEFKPDIQYDCWHDRAAFHFLTKPDQIYLYASLVRQYVRSKGFLVIGTFSKNGPEKCSGLPITQYNAETLTALLADGFEKINCITHDHHTPFHTIQNFLYCAFQSR